jgi:hypothetical protein
VIDGYSVQDAASVLGVPEGRVWELLARGVLSGTPEGDSMRVYLRASPGPVATAGSGDERPRGNGHGGSQAAAGEASAFRELLTEFRNLTERYGQALLALGEARGEVAGLRSRVELLEARVDLRLPTPLGPSPVAWEQPAVSARVPEPASIDEIEAVAPTPVPAPRAARSRKAASTRTAVAGFAEALQRAQDPTAADLGEAPVPLTAIVEPPASIEEEAEAEVPAAAPAPAEPATAAAAAPVEPEAPPPTYSPAVVEPDWFADGDFAWLDAAEVEARADASVATSLAPRTQEPEAPSVSGSGVSTDPVDTDVQPAAPGPAGEPLTGAGVAAPVPTSFEPPAEPPVEPEAEPVVAAPVPAPIESSAQTEAELPIEAASIASDEPAGPVLPDLASVLPPVDALSPAEPFRPAPAADEEEVMWLGADRSSVASSESQAASSLGGRILTAAAPAAPESAGGPGLQMAREADEALPPPLAMTEQELAILARNEGWDDAEVAAIRAMISPPAPRTVELPGATDLDEAMAAWHAVPVGPDASAPPLREWAKPAAASDQVTASDDWLFDAEPAPPPPAARPPAVPFRPAADDRSLDRRRGPAAAAYRRLRRLFPG